ncbi:MAG: RNA-binding S4 domain-containing protein [Sulfobacillus sp.]
MNALPITTPYIALKDALKMSGLVMTGGMVKQILQDGEVSVNSVPETRRGRKLYPGDIVVYGSEQLVIVSGVKP